jgi:hypothetical protein
MNAFKLEQINKKRQIIDISFIFFQNDATNVIKKIFKQFYNCVAAIIKDVFILEKFSPVL